MSEWPEVPTPGGDLATMRAAERDLDLRATSVRADGIELDRIAQQVSADWVGLTADSFAVRVGAARVAIDCVSDTHREAARLIGSYCAEWSTAEQASRRAHQSIDDAFGAYVRDGTSRAQTLASEIRSAIERLDDSVDDIPVIGGALSTVTGAATDGLGWMAEELIERLLDWNPSTPTPVYKPVLDDDVVIDSAASVASAIGNAAEWGVDRLLDGIDAVVDFVGGAIQWAVDALKAVGETLADAISDALRIAGDAVDALLDLGRDIATSVASLVTDAARIVFDAVATAFDATVDFLISVGRTVAEIIDFLVDVGVTALGILLILARHKYGDPAERRVEDDVALDSAAFRRWRRDPDYRQYVLDRRDLADLAYGVGSKDIPDGWEVVDEYPGTDGFSATVFRNPETHEVVISYRGTNPEEIDDIREDALNAANLPNSQGRQAIELARQIADDPRLAGYDVSYTGHSLGGSLASTASIATGNPATTFNAAGVGAGNYDQAIDAGGAGSSEEQIVNFHTDIDILTTAQDQFDVQPASGAQLTVGSTSTSAVDSHALDSFDFDEVGVK
ncbi:DUF2974 domain-containing protein [Aeromicrobium sp. CFBP 8757]|uniref:Mbeg1-like protein n=1 Tax=Aeromicrobium sp. CFBP 8757 TaxID=2775288 RepID=UPI00177D1A57|nr:DUF2974 domain-containing protein [Aeromicrobium sp. CFBP 8757]